VLRIAALPTVAALIALFVAMFLGVAGNGSAQAGKWCAG
jgi:hypothetical protein